MIGLHKAAFGLFGIISLAGCVSMSGLGSGKQDSGTWRVHYARSGGFAGERKTLTIDSKGGMVTADDRQGKWLMRNLSPSEVQPVASSVRELMASSPSGGSHLNSKCADCLHYKLDIVWQGKRLKTELDDSSLPGSPYAPLIGQLNALYKLHPPQ